MTKVLIWPFPTEQPANHGIGRVVHAQNKYLPALGIKLTRNPNEAEVIACHTQQWNFPRVDALHLHGLYWTGDKGSGVYTKWHQDANTQIAAAARRARALTVPSGWVGECIKRDMRLVPRLIGHGIEPEEWTAGANGGYVLWNKNRDGDVCDPLPAYFLADHGVKVISTFAPGGRAIPGSMTLTGQIPADQMREIIRNTDIYLATVKETFGIGTLEAMACGVPVVGYQHGGTAELVRHELDGYLVAPGDLDGLRAGVEWVHKHRAALSMNAKIRAREFTWARVMKQYAELYHELAHTPEPAGVTVVVTCYNYGRYLTGCLDSLLAQSYRPDQIIVIDDGSTDDSGLVSNRYNTQGVEYIYQENSGVASARNRGLSLARHPFVICLDADDQLAPRYVEVCRQELIKDRGLGIAYTGLEVFNDEGIRQRTGWPPDFEIETDAWERQTTVSTPPSNCFPSASMFRRAMWERAGGYKQEYKPAEDTEFWTRGLSVGFSAKRVTDSPWIWYRSHPGSASRNNKYRPIDDWLPWMRDRNYPLAAPSKFAPPVRSYSAPKVSVVIPVGPGHAQYLPQAIESLLGQTMRDWEVIVVWDEPVRDFGPRSETERPYPFVRWYYADIETQNVGKIMGAGVSRNVGLNNCRAPLVLCLDADDQLHPQALAKLCKAYSESGGRYIYGDWLERAGDDLKEYPSPEYDPSAWVDLSEMGGKHIVSVLMATEDARRVGGFDESLLAWEDWDFFIKCATLGIHGRRIPEPTLIVRRQADSRTARLFANNGQRAELIEKLAARYAPYVKGIKVMAPCCGGNGESLLAARLAYEGMAPDTGGLSLHITTRNGKELDHMVIQGAPHSGVTPVRMEFIGERAGGVTYTGKQGRQYVGGNNALERYANVHPDDVATLTSLGDWRVLAVAVPMQRTITQENWTPTISESVDSRAAAVEVEDTDAEIEELKPIETAGGVVKRKRVKEKVKDTPLKELPPLDEPAPTRRGK